jgi:hypothetical protein
VAWWDKWGGWIFLCLAPLWATFFVLNLVFAHEFAWMWLLNTVAYPVVGVWMIRRYRRLAELTRIRQQTHEAVMQKLGYRP